MSEEFQWKSIEPPEDDSEKPEWFEDWCGDVMHALNGVHLRLDKLEAAQHETSQTLRTVMVGWNAFLKSAEAQLRHLFKGTIPAPMLKKLLQMAFKGIEDMERKGK